MDLSFENCLYYMDNFCDIRNIVTTNMVFFKIKKEKKEKIIRLDFFSDVPYSLYS